MKYDRFEQLPVWQAAAKLAAEMLRWSARRELLGKGDLGNQLQRASLSISNNIAEGFERGTTNELLMFLYYARGSAGEVRSMLCVMGQMHEFAALGTDIADFQQRCESISRQIRGWTSSLQNSDIEGTRYLNDRSKRRYDNRKRRAAFEEKMGQFMKQKECELVEQRNKRSST